jgi:hypothetical protein
MTPTCITCLIANFPHGDFSFRLNFFSFGLLYVRQGKRSISAKTTAGGKILQVRP